MNPLFDPMLAKIKQTRPGDIFTENAFSLGFDLNEANADYSLAAKSEFIRLGYLEAKTVDHHHGKRDVLVRTNMVCE